MSEVCTWLDLEEIPNADWWRIYGFVQNLQSDNLLLLVIHQQRKFQKPSSPQEQHKKIAITVSQTLWPKTSKVSDYLKFVTPHYHIFFPAINYKQIIKYKAAMTNTTPTFCLYWVARVSE